MTKIWNRLRCALNRHRWQAMRVEGQAARECRDCGRREFDGGGGDDLDYETVAANWPGQIGGV